MRSLLFVPGDSPEKMTKALGCGADAIIIDLEDAVAPAHKSQARRETANFLKSFDAPQGPRLYVRVNDMSSSMVADDLEATVAPCLSGIMLPKARSGEDVKALAHMLGGAEVQKNQEPGALSIVVIATETPEAVLNMGSFANCGDRLEGLSWGAEDLSAAIGATANRDEQNAYTPPFMLARNLCLLAAAAAGVQAIDTVYTQFRDLDGLALECKLAARDGFTGKMAIHPSQIPIINEAFTPSQTEIDEARRVQAAFAAEPDAGVVSLDGRMIDRPHLMTALRILERAQLAGLE
jgi:citrate lyase subunit beta/citryl-CoA lyase